MTKFKLSVLVSAFLISGSAFAATQGGLGTDSTGTSDVTIIKDNAVQISDVADLDFEQHALLAADESLSDTVCVFSSTGKYSIKVSSAGTGFELTGSDTEVIEYSVKWGTEILTHDVALTNLTADATSLTCDGTNNAAFTVTVDAASFNSAGPDTYTDTLTLLVEPE